MIITGTPSKQYARARGFVATVDAMDSPLSAGVVAQNGIFGGMVVWDSIPTGGITTLTYATGATVDGQVELAIAQADDDATRTSFTRMARTGVVAIGAASSVVSVALTAAFTPVLWKPYWLVFTTDSATATFVRSTSGNRTAMQFKALQIAKTSGGGATGIPTSLTSMAANNGTVIWIAAS